MKLNQAPNLRVEDFETEQSWIGRLFIQLNPFIQGVNQVFDNGIDFSTNIRAMTRDFEVTTVFQALSFQWAYSATIPPQILTVAKATKGSTLTPAILLPAWSFDATKNSISVTNLVEITDTGVAALSGPYKYTLRVTV